MPSTMWLGRKSCPVCSGHWSCPFLRKGLALLNRAAAGQYMDSNRSARSLAWSERCQESLPEVAGVWARTVAAVAASLCEAQA